MCMYDKIVGDVGRSKPSLKYAKDWDIISKAAA